MFLYAGIARYFGLFRHFSYRKNLTNLFITPHVFTLKSSKSSSKFCVLLMPPWFPRRFPPQAPAWHLWWFLLCLFQNHAVVIDFFFVAGQARINLLHALFAPAKFLPFLCQCSDVRFVALDQFQPFQKRNVSARRRLFRIVNSTNARRAIPPTHFFDLVNRPSVIFDSLITQHNLKVNVSKKVPFDVPFS